MWVLIIVSAIHCLRPFRAHWLDDSDLGLKPQAIYRCRSAAIMAEKMIKAHM